MIQYSIEELHQLYALEDYDFQAYTDELFKEIEFQQKRLNAFVTITKQNMITHKNNSLLDGIPYALKDNFHTKNIKTTASSHMLENYISIYDAHVFTCLSQNGACLVGKTSMDEFGMGSTNKTAITGPVCNPWDCSRIAGGSSGGSAAIVASGVVPFALGTDTGDSIRKPAGYCGAVGFKPTWGRVSRFGMIPYASSLDTVGALTRNVRDMTIVMEAISGHDKRDMTSSKKTVPHYLQNLNQDIRGLKIAVFHSISDTIKNKQIKDNFETVIQTLKSLGADVENVSFPNQLLENLLAVYTIIANTEATSHLACLDGIKYGLSQKASDIDEMMLKTRTQGFGKQVKTRLVLGYLASSYENQEKMFRKAQKVRRLIAEELQKVYEHYDIVLTPNSGNIAPKISDDYHNYSLIENHLCLANLTGTPSLTLPTGFVDGMPIAVNMTGRLFEEQTVFNVAYALENAFEYKNQFKREG